MHAPADPNLIQSLFGLHMLTELWQSVLLVTAALLIARRASERGINLKPIWRSLTLGLLIAAMVAYQVVFTWQHPHGPAISIALAGALLALLVMMRFQRMPILACLDVCAPLALLGQLLVRWGVFFDQQVSNSSYIYQRYALLWELSAFGALLWIEQRFQRRLHPGDSVLLYGMLSSLGHLLAGGAQQISLVISVACAVILSSRQIWLAGTQRTPEGSGPAA
jgi:prolipoprotein diacylglyceryltransferase